ncbi:DUF2946 domain-containing protein [Rugamonas sp. CCM 8940]|uniref:DUF2946 domain-containing protein n=1 Tax=Rugamonas sp. CCM 8940 TaxID=2765359 RepID=UPI0018F7996E|nr:DUF2946 domain-containing protein [Rugamonas sp. CCM 8940]MBJ7312986.1 DUF2946 domain-containing protein [Rugamonas sp. CCM 8940]
MKIDRVTRLFAAWIACFALLAAALVPAMTHLLPSASATMMADICSSGGGTSAAASSNAADPAAPADKGMHGEHCQYCYSHANASTLPPSIPLTLAPAGAPALQPTLFYQSPGPLFIRANAQSRAPPALS